MCRWGSLCLLSASLSAGLVLTGCRAIRLDAPRPVAYLSPIQNSIPLILVIPPEVAAAEYEMKTGTSRLSGTRFVQIGPALVDYVDAILVPHFTSAVRAEDPGSGPVVVLSLADYSVNVTSHRVYVALRADHRTADGRWISREFGAESRPYNRRRGPALKLKQAIRANTDSALRDVLEDAALWLRGP